MCCDPGAPAAAQTVLVPMAGVAGSLQADQHALLTQTRYRRSREGPTICRELSGRPVFSFRDFERGALEWTYLGGQPDPDVNGALRAVLSAMYRSPAAAGVRWERGLLVIIDNTYFFHGRTAGSASTTAATRHLKRLRILSE